MKLCPFCGYKGIDYTITKDNIVSLYCSRCAAEGPPTPIGGGVSKEMAIKNATSEWNIRKN